MRMTGTDVVKDILALSIHAPSGDNAQPWRFAVHDDSIEIFNATESDATLYNYKQRGSLLSHGAVIENITILSEPAGLRAVVTYFPQSGAVARITLVPSPKREDPLAAVLERRATNRKPYEKKGLRPAHAQALLAAAQSRGHELRVVEDRETIHELASVLSLNERLLMENRQLHDFLFGMIRWSKKEEQARPGLYVRTMEFPFPVRLLLRYVVCRWGAAEFLNRFGLSRAIPRQSAELYESSSALCALLIENLSDESFVKAGRAFERLWLTAESLGVALQPVTALPYLAQRLETGDTESLSSEHIECIRSAYAQIAQTFNLQGSERIAMLFRVGYGPAPSARSAKAPPVYISQ